MWFNEETQKWEKYGTSPIPDAYWKFEPTNQPERSKREDDIMYLRCGICDEHYHVFHERNHISRCGALNTVETR
jgi:hypothetical protein